MRQRSKIVLTSLICLSMVVSGELCTSGYGATFPNTTDKVTVFNKITDWFATVGKSEKEKRLILMKRRVERKKKRSLKLIDQRRKEKAGNR